MRRFFLNIYKCDNPLIDIHELIELVNSSEMATDVSIYLIEPDNLSLKLRNCGPGAINFVWKMINLDDIDARNCNTGYLDRVCDNPQTKAICTAGVCLYATNINEDADLSNGEDKHLNTTPTSILIQLLHCYNLVNNINCSVK